MKFFLIKTAVRTQFRLTSRARASRQIREEAARYAELARTLGPEKSATPVRVPSMPGVDEDMRDWSVFMILEHNAIVNRGIGGIVKSLARGEEPASAGDPKKEVMPSESPGSEQLEIFRDSVEAHLNTVSDLPRLRGTRSRDHPLFGPLDVHGWHCMFRLHLTIHRKQAEAVAAIVNAGKS